MSGFKFGRSSLRRIKGVNPNLVKCAIRTLAKSRYDMTIPWMGGVRTPEEQNKIFQDGNSKCDGYNILSYHQIEASNNGYGNAIDIIPYIPNMSISDLYKEHGIMNYFARMMMIEWQEMIYEDQVEGVMIWGGTFGKTSWDRPHYELRY